jgi:hypothetical protein
MMPQRYRSMTLFGPQVHQMRGIQAAERRVFPDEHGLQALQDNC